MSNFMIRRLSQHSLHNSIQSKRTNKSHKTTHNRTKQNYILNNLSLNKAGIIKMKLKNCFNYAI
jgi:hypothetical protein